MNCKTSDEGRKWHQSLKVENVIKPRMKVANVINVTCLANSEVGEVGKARDDIDDVRPHEAPAYARGVGCHLDFHPALCLKDYAA